MAPKKEGEKKEEKKEAKDADKKKDDKKGDKKDDKKGDKKDDKKDDKKGKDGKGKDGKDSRGSDRSKSSEEEPPPPAVDPLIAEQAERIEAQQTELIRLRQMLEVIVSGEGQNLREAKILELFKKNRTLKLAFDRERAVASRLQSELDLVQNQLLNRKKEEIKLSFFYSPEEMAKREAREVSELRARLEQASTKTIDAMAKVDILNIEIAKLHRIIQREVGEHIPLAKVLEGGTNWKGRAQQITLLKDRMKDLKILLEQYEAPINPSASYEEQKKAYESHQRRMEEYEANRRREYDNLAVSYLATNEELGVIRQRLDGVLARRNILEKELKQAKEKMTLLVSKSQNDDRLIAALRLELATLRQAAGAPHLKPAGPLQLSQVQREHKLAASFNELKNHCAQQDLQIAAQAELIEYLRNTTLCPYQEDTMCQADLKEGQKDYMDTLDSF